MKNLFLISLVLSLVFAFGCQDTFITDPTQPLAEDQNAQVNLFQDEANEVNHNVIGLSYELTDPASGDACDLMGQVEYETSTFPSFGTSGTVKVKVKLAISARLFKLSGEDHPSWRIEKKTEDIVTLSETDPRSQKLNKSYTISNRDDVKLHVRYLITSKRVQIVNVFLRNSGIEPIYFD